MTSVERLISPRSYLPEQNRKASHELRRDRTAVRAAVAHAEPAAAEFEHRRERAQQMQSAIFHL
jgi:hypothetical protein